MIMFGGCVDETIEMPDAAVKHDACTREPSGDCCALLPDILAVQKCAAMGLEHGQCGTLVCTARDCSAVSVAFCGPDGDCCT